MVSRWESDKRLGYGIKRDLKRVFLRITENDCEFSLRNNER